jgi:hypothetical protein
MIRFAIWAAVSTEAQASADKISLHDQEARCRATATAKGWQESAGPFVVPGESRTRFINLRDAEAEIPELRALLDAAQHGRYDVLVLYDYNRLRELIDPVARTLAAYHLQIYSITQPIEPQPPETFNQYRADSAWMMQGLSQIVSRSQISDLRRKYETGMPARVRDRGLPAISIPFGYRKPPGRETDRAAIPVQDPVQIPLILKFRDLLFQGRSLRQIVAFANATGIKSPQGKRWSPQTIRDILRNPFYAGYNRWGLSKNYTDPRTGQRLRKRDVNLADVIVEKGHHDPLWDDETHRRLLRELDERGNSYRGKHATQLSRIMICAACQSPLWMQHNGSRAEPERAIWRCSNKACGAANLHHTPAVEQIGVMLQTEIRQAGDPGLAPRAVDATLDRSKLDELLKRRERLVDIFQDDGLTKAEYLARRGDLDNQIFQTEKDLADFETRANTRAERLELLRSFATLAETIPAWLAHGDPLEVNRILRLLLEYISVDGERVAGLRFRD